MKKLMFICIPAVLLFSLAACNNDDDDAPALGASVEVTVKNLLGIPREGMTVYLYKDHEVTEDTQKSDAAKQSITNSDGVAVFSLRFNELNIIESQTSLYFAVFYTHDGSDHVQGSTGVTVSRNDEEKVEIKILL